MTCILYFLGHILLALHCSPPAPDIWIEPERALVVAIYQPRPPAWAFN